MTTKTALLTAFEKGPALVGFAKELTNLGWNLLASSGTKKFLDTYDITSYDVASLVGEPILGHKVVTLSREIYAAILADLDDEQEVAELKRIGVGSIDLVYVDLYPLAAELAKPDRTYESVIAKTDIGGPTLLRAAAKGRRLVLCKTSQFKPALDMIGQYPGQIIRPDRSGPRMFLSWLAAEAEETVAGYAKLSADFHRSVADGNFFKKD